MSIPKVVIGPEKVMEAVRELRNRMKLSQTKFGDLIGKTLPTIQRYETQVAPVGEALADLVFLAEESGHRDIAETLRSALRRDIGEKIMRAIEPPSVTVATKKRQPA